MSRRHSFSGTYVAFILAELIIFFQPLQACLAASSHKKSNDQVQQKAPEPKWNIVKREQDDEELLRAEAEALKQWPQFLNALNPLCFLFGIGPTKKEPRINAAASFLDSLKYQLNTDN